MVIRTSSHSEGKPPVTGLSLWDLRPGAECMCQGPGMGSGLRAAAADDAGGCSLGLPRGVAQESNNGDTVGM